MINRIRHHLRAVGEEEVMSVISVRSKVTMVSALALLLGFGPMAGLLEAQSGNPPGTVAESKNMRLVGHDDLQGRSVYKGEVHQENGRFIAYVGHGDDPDPGNVTGRIPGQRLNSLTGDVEPNGTSIVDVTDPRNPKYLHHIPAPLHASGHQVCAGDDLPNGQSGNQYLLRRTRAEDGDRHEMWVTGPSKPEFVGTVQGGLVSRHKSWWECSTGIAYLPSQPKGWNGRGMSIFDLSDPANPKFIRHFGVPGSQPGQDPAGRRMTALHEALYRDGKVYMAYGTSTNGILQILDNDKLLKGDPNDPYDPLNPTDEQLLYPQIGRLDSPSFWGVHTAFPMLGVELPQYQVWKQGTPRDFVVTVSESTANGCNQPMQDMVIFVDITDPEHPYPVSNFQVRESEGNYCQRGGRFGAHATQWNFTDVYDNRIVWVSYFNAGVRGIDVRDPFHPVEVAYYIPAVTQNTIEADGKRVISTNNVEVDERGFVYIFDKNGTGMHILEPTGEAAEIANLPRR